MRMSRPERNLLGFTLIELMVTMALLTVIGLVLISTIDSTSQIWKRTRGKVETFREARAAFETLTSRLKQATVNTYWSYDDPNDPDQYERESELHFLTGQAEDLIGSPSSQTPTQAIFFQAPAGYSVVHKGLENLLNSIGYYTEFGTDDTFRPPFVTSPQKYRYRLMEFIQPSEEFDVYDVYKDKPDLTSVAWFQPVLAANRRPLAENVVALVLRVRRAAEEDPTGTAISSDYTYDSRDKDNVDTHHQLPPIVDVTMVAIDEKSAARLASGSTPPLSGVINPSLFTDMTDYEADLAKLSAELQKKDINYRIFEASIPLREAKWSETATTP